MEMLTTTETLNAEKKATKAIEDLKEYWKKQEAMIDENLYQEMGDFLDSPLRAFGRFQRIPADAILKKFKDDFLRTRRDFKMQIDKLDADHNKRKRAIQEIFKKKYTDNTKFNEILREAEKRALSENALSFCKGQIQLKLIHVANQKECVQRLREETSTS